MLLDLWGYVECCVSGASFSVVMMAMGDAWLEGALDELQVFGLKAWWSPKNSV
jgi:hypothetical protein